VWKLDRLGRSLQHYKWRAEGMFKARARKGNAAA